MLPSLSTTKAPSGNRTAGIVRLQHMPHNFPTPAHTHLRCPPPNRRPGAGGCRRQIPAQRCRCCWRGCAASRRTGPPRSPAETPRNTLIRQGGAFGRGVIVIVEAPLKAEMVGRLSSVHAAGSEWGPAAMSDCPIRLPPRPCHYCKPRSPFPWPWGPPGGLSSYCSTWTGEKPTSQPAKQLPTFHGGAVDVGSPRDVGRRQGSPIWEVCEQLVGNGVHLRQAQQSQFVARLVSL